MVQAARIARMKVLPVSQVGLTVIAPSPFSAMVVIERSGTGRFQPLRISGKRPND